MMQGFPEGVVHGGLTAQSALVFDRDRGERITPEETIEKTRLTMVLKSHSEAKRRRTERINAHLSTLRTIIPDTCKV